MDRNVRLWEARGCYPEKKEGEGFGHRGSSGILGTSWQLIPKSCATNNTPRANEMTQLVKVSAAKSNNLSLIPGTCLVEEKG